MIEHIKAVGLIRHAEGIYVADEFDGGEKHIAYHQNVNILKLCLVNNYRKKFSPKKLVVLFKPQIDGIKYIIKTMGKKKNDLRTNQQN